MAIACAVASAAARADRFELGIASGDVTETSVVLWTRVDQPVRLVCELATTADGFSSPLQGLVVVVDAETDYTAKIVVNGLTPGMRYYYRFRDEADPQQVSAIGTFQTAPAAGVAAPLRFIFSGDTNFAYAPFTVAASAADEDASLFFWFGDTIYADVPSGGLGVARSLPEYRAKYRQVRGDPGIRALSAKMATITGPDDHEVANDYAGQGGETPTDQINAGYRAHFEYMPITQQGVATDAYRVFRRFAWGANAEFFIIDGRRYRARSAEAECEGNLDPSGFFLGPLSADPDCQNALLRPRTMLGEEQLAWLKEGLAASAAKNKFIVNNVPLSFLGIFPYDRWDGYDAERRELLEFIDAHGITGVVFLTTDFHANFLNPNVMWHFRAFRPEYHLPQGVVVSEIVAGPLGNETARQSVIGLAASILGSQATGLATGLERFAFQRIAAVNRFSLTQTDRVAYTVVDVSATGDLQVTFRGLPPERVHEDGAAAETFFESPLLEERISQTGGVCGGVPCLLPSLFPVAGLLMCLRRSTRVGE